MNRPATTIAGEIIAAIRINALRGTFAASTPGQIDQWLQPFIDRLNATEATTAMTVPLLSTFACFSGQQDRRWRGIINGPDTEAIADADSREELCRALAGQHEKHEPIATELRLQASQENHDGEPWDTMLTASFVIDQQAAEIARLEAELANASCLQQTVTIASQTIRDQRSTIERHQQRYEQLRDANNDTFQRLTHQLAEAREQSANADKRTYEAKRQRDAVYQEADGKIRKAIEPVEHWYQSDEHPQRATLDILADIVADLQTDRSENLNLRGTISNIRDTVIAMKDSRRIHPRMETVITAEGPDRIHRKANEALAPRPARDIGRLPQATLKRHEDGTIELTDAPEVFACAAAALRPLIDTHNKAVRDSANAATDLELAHMSIDTMKARIANLEAGSANPDARPEPNPDWIHDQERERDDHDETIRRGIGGGPGY